MGIKPDYENTSTRDLYIRLAWSALERLRQAEVLSVPRLDVRRAQREDGNWQDLVLPSWVPDWRWTESTPLSLLGAKQSTEEGAGLKNDYTATAGSNFEVEFGTTEHRTDESSVSASNALPALLRVREYTVAKVTQSSPRSWTLQKPAGRHTLFEQARVLQENQIQVAEWEPVFQPSDAPSTYKPTNETFTAAAVDTLTVGRSTYTKDQKYAAWESYESRQRFLRILPRFGLHHFLVSYVVVILVQRMLRYLGFPNPEMQFRIMTNSLVNRKCARAMGSGEANTAFEYLGLVPGLCKLDDHVVLVQGVRLPLLLRPKDEHSIQSEGKSKTVQTWELVGDAYIHGLMKGKCWDNDKCEDIWIC